MPSTMVRESARSVRAVAAALLVAVAATGCGIKGPLTPAKKPEPEAAKEATKAPATAKP